MTFCNYHRIPSRDYHGYCVVREGRGMVRGIRERFSGCRCETAVRQPGHDVKCHTSPEENKELKNCSLAG